MLAQLLQCFVDVFVTVAFAIEHRRDLAAGKLLRPADDFRYLMLGDPIRANRHDRYAEKIESRQVIDTVNHDNAVSGDELVILWMLREPVAVLVVQFRPSLKTSGETVLDSPFVGIAAVGQQRFQRNHFLFKFGIVAHATQYLVFLRQKPVDDLPAQAPTAFVGPSPAWSHAPLCT